MRQHIECKTNIVSFLSNVVDLDVACWDKRLPSMPKESEKRNVHENKVQQDHGKCMWVRL